MNQRLVFVFVCVCVGLGLWALLTPNSAAPGMAPVDTGVGGSTVRDTATPTLVERERPLDADAGARVALQPIDPSPDVAATTGSLVVRVVWSDHGPAAGVAIQVLRRRPGLPHRALARVVSDTEGVAEFSVLPTGAITLRSERGGEVGVEIAGGRPQEVTFTLPQGVAVEGRVRDGNGASVAGASVWLTAHEIGWTGGRLIAHADADGGFRLRDVPREQSLGAVAPGYAPSELVDLEQLETERQPVVVELRLVQPGGALAGRVVDRDGVPVAGALVAVGKADKSYAHRSGGKTIEYWQPRTTPTDGDGRFEFEGLAPGKQPVEVGTERHPNWRGEGEIVAHTTTWLEIQLTAGVTVHGVVRGADRAPLADVMVRGFVKALREEYLQFGRLEDSGVFGGAFAVSDAAGHYRLEQATAGAVHLYAMPQREGRRPDEAQVWDATVLETAPGATYAWDPVLAAGLSLEGVVLYHDGTPMPHVFVTAAAADASGRHVIPTDAQGRFRHVRLQAKPYDVSVQLRLRSPPKGMPPLVQRGVWPGQQALRLVAAFDPPPKLAPAKVSGRVRDAAGRLARPGALAVQLYTGPGRYAGTVEGDAFHFDRVEPGRSQLVVLSDETTIHIGPWFDLQPGADLDVGTLVTEPGGSLRLRIERGPGTERLSPKISLVHEGGSGRSLAPGTADEVRVDNLCPGVYRIHMYGEGLASSYDRSCTVVAGDQAEAAIPLRAAVQREIEVDFGPRQEVTEVRVADGAGSVMFDFQPGSYALPRPYRIKLSLPLGSFVLRAVTSAGTSREVAFTMASLAAGQPLVRLDLR